MRAMPCPSVLTRAAALDHLAEAAPRVGRLYADGRNTDPGPVAEPSTTALSPFLRRRLLLEPEVVAAALAAHGTREAGRFVDEVFWRSYFKGHLETHPAAWTGYLDALAGEQERLGSNAGLRRAVEGAPTGRPRLGRGAGAAADEHRQHPPQPGAGPDQPVQRPPRVRRQRQRPGP